MTQQAAIIGAGLGGLTTAALLLKAGWQVTVLEAHTYPGGSAGTFYHKGYRFDAGATLAGGFTPGGPHARIAEILDIDWPVQPVDPSWVVHLPNQTVTQWAQKEHWREERQRAFPEGEGFWQLQERLADISWQISSLHFPWPPASTRDLASLAVAIRPNTLLAAPYLVGNITNLVPSRAGLDLRAFIDLQLLISAQTTARYANPLYACAALDLPRRGVNQVTGGIGALSQVLADWIIARGGQVLYRQAVEAVTIRNGQAVGLRTRQGLDLEADTIIANLSPAALGQMLQQQAPRLLQSRSAKRTPSWGAFTLYLGLDASQLPAGLAEHHQVLVDPDLPLGEGNSVFISLSSPDDRNRAPDGNWTATLSSHTAVEPWWHLANNDPQAYAVLKEDYQQRMLASAERAIPGIRRAVRLALPATPITWQFYTRRPLGRVGGYPQTSILRARGPATGIRNLWLVGDSIFPGQSTAGVTLGALRVAQNVISTNK